MSEPIKFWRYSIPSIDGEGWGIIVLDSTGMFAAVSDYGNAAHHWGHHGCAGIREFFAKGLSPGYALPKLFYDRQQYDGQETLQLVKEYILDARRMTSFTREKAREEFDLLQQFDGLQSEHDFMRWYEETSISDAGEFYCMGYPASARAFVDKLLPRFYEVVAGELAAEREEIHV
jgi:hypothetical protein